MQRGQEHNAEERVAIRSPGQSSNPGTLALYPTISLSNEQSMPQDSTAVKGVLWSLEVVVRSCEVAVVGRERVVRLTVMCVWGTTRGAAVLLVAFADIDTTRGGACVDEVTGRRSEVAIDRIGRSFDKLEHGWHRNDDRLIVTHFIKIVWIAVMTYRCIHQSLDASESYLHWFNRT